MQIKLTSVYVDSQDEAMASYTEVLGFAKKRDIPVGAFKFLTVVSPEEPDGTELLLEPGDNPATKAFKNALHEQGIPSATFCVADVQAGYERLKHLGVQFSLEPTPMGPTVAAVFADTCGNYIQLNQR
jgi:predicted enzyme related to lactoylglutathione lyase